MNERQTQIAEAAIALFLSEGVGVSTAKVAKAAGVSNGTLFHAFPTKQDLIDGIFLATKTGMYAALPDPNDGDLDKAKLHGAWTGYLNWARAAPAHHKVMHLLNDSGLASEEARQRADAMGADHFYGMQSALEKGLISGPNVAFIGALIFFHIDQVIDQSLTGADEEMAFDMLCRSIGLTQ